MKKQGDKRSGLRLQVVSYVLAAVTVLITVLLVVTTVRSSDEHKKLREVTCSVK